jgi:hypothetical protein
MLGTIITILMAGSIKYKLLLFFKKLKKKFKILM